MLLKPYSRPYQTFTEPYRPITRGLTADTRAPFFTCFSDKCMKSCLSGLLSLGLWQNGQTRKDKDKERRQSIALQDVHFTSTWYRGCNLNEYLAYTMTYGGVINAPTLGGWEDWLAFEGTAEPSADLKFMPAPPPTALYTSDREMSGNIRFVGNECKQL